ncbi:hypothetical protein ACVXHA_00675 [Escherichia coli]
MKQRGENRYTILDNGKLYLLFCRVLTPGAWEVAKLFMTAKNKLREIGRPALKGGLVPILS